MSKEILADPVYPTKLKDSGTRSTFTTGAVRDAQVGKGRFDLLPVDALIHIADVSEAKVNLHELTEPQLLVNATNHYHYYLQGLRDKPYIEKSCAYLLQALDNKFRDTQYTPLPGMLGLARLPYAGLQQVAIIFELGANKYAARNWEKGIPTFRFWDSGERHLKKYIAGYTDEPHLAMACWNFMCLLQTEIWIADGKLPKELDTLPLAAEYRLE